MQKTIKLNEPWLLVTLITCLVLSACGYDDSDEGNIVQASSELTLPEPIVRSRLSDNGTVNAYISIDGGARQAMVVAGGTASIQLTVPTGSHTFTITLEYIPNTPPSTPVVLGEASTIANVTEGGNTVSFSDDDYDFSAFDEDNDGLSNLDELTTVTISADTPAISSNCIPFGRGSPWPPFAGFVYQDVSPFNLQVGSQLAFDLSVINDADIGLDIYMAPTSVNGGNVEAGPFTQIVSNSQVPANPRGDTISGNFELKFVAENEFDFPGGGLIIRFSNPSASFVNDTTCDANLVSASSTDTSGFFVERFFNDMDGVSPWDSGSTNAVGVFRVRPYPTVSSSIPPVINLVNSFSLQNSSTAGIAVDGNTIYITKTGTAEMDTYSTSGTFIGTIPLVGVTTLLGGYTGAVTREAGRLYLTAMYDSNRNFAIYLFDTAGNFISNTIFPGLRNSTGIGYDGTNTFVNQNDAPNHLYRLDPVNGMVLDDFASNPNHGQRLGVDYWAGGNVLIESFDNGISALDPSTGIEIQHFTATDLGYDAQTFGVAVQGDTLYLMTSTTVYIYTLSTGL